ncbi:MAG TPA: FkbM family methyltransferase [Methanofastidiosum sp.]|nr:FkbM family methyltransferase [Methanofastidiosum sp.]
MKKKNDTVNRKEKNNQTNDIKSIVFKEGILEGITLCTTEKYQKVAYPNGNTDVQMMNDIYSSNPSGKTIFDVGTFIGASSFVFSKFVGKTGKVIGFEPNPFNMNRISLNKQKNPELSKNIVIFPFALGKDDENLKMTLSSQIDTGFSSTSRLEGTHPKLHNSELPEGFEEISVEVKKLDTFLKENKFKPDIIKVDIEGAEYDFLLGALETIRKYKPIFYIEIHSEYCAIRCFEILRSEGYSVTIINEEPDNRIMIKAKYIERSEKVSDSTILSSALRNLDSTFLLLTSMNKQIDEITKSIEIYKNRIKELEVDNERITSSRYELENKINELERVIRLIEGSNSWKITKPVRLVMSILRKNKIKD